MKIKRVTPLNDGMNDYIAEALWEKIEKFASYSFCKSHAVAYTILSYWTCWLKVRYPAEYFAAQLSIVREDKYPNLVKDARSCGIEVVPPDVNFSSDKFEIKDERTIVMPFSAIKGCSETIAKKIVAVREEVGHFITKMHFEELASRKGSGINVRVVNNLDLVGAFAGIEPSQPSATSELRRKDQVTLMPGLIVDTITTSNITKMDEQKKNEVLSIHSEVLDCKDCDLCHKVHPLPVVGGSNCRYMVVFDNPTADEEEKGKLFVGKSASLVKNAMKANGISPAQGFYTTLVRAKKEGKYLTNAQINGCAKFLQKEVELLKVGAIVCLGSASVRHFLPNVKSPASEVGNAYYVKELDATVIIGMNPIQILFDQGKAEGLDATFRKLSEVLS
jgi:DNA polymerase-3 subunit alpha